MRRRWLSLFGLIVVILVIDQATKLLVINSLSLYETVRPVPALVPFFQITYSLNTGAAFGFLPFAGNLILVIALVVVVSMIYFYPRIPANGRLMRFAVGLVCGGALGNALDRLQYGYVVDFIHYQIPGVVSNVSNLADHAIVIGIILIFLESWLLDRREKKTAEQPVLESETHEDGSFQ